MFSVILHIMVLIMHLRDNIVSVIRLPVPSGPTREERWSPVLDMGRVGVMGCANVTRGTVVPAVTVPLILVPVLEREM